MSDMMKDLTNYYKSDALTSVLANKKLNIQQKGDNTKLDMTDFIQLMITQLTNQGIDESVDTSDMLNQMIQMQMVETMANLTDASIMSYAASLVGKEVTVGKFDSEGNLQEIVGTVTGTGTMNGKQVIFVGDEYYQMNEILAVGKLPPKRTTTRSRIRRSPAKAKSPMRPRSRMRRRNRMKPRSPTGRRIRNTAAKTAHPTTRGRDVR